MSKDPVAVYPEPITITSAVAVNQLQSHAQNKFEADYKESEEPKTVPPRVALENDQPFDKSYGRVLKLCYTLSIACSIWIFVNARPKYKTNSDGTKEISDYFLPKVEECCLEIFDQRHTYGLCAMLKSEEEDVRRLEAKKSSKFVGDEGIFDAFLDRPDIVCYLSFVIISFTLIWIQLLKKYAKPMVIVTEAIKVLALLSLTWLIITSSNSIMTTILMIIVILFYRIYVYKSYDHIMKSANVLSHAAVLVRDNANMTFGLFGLKIVYSLQAALLLITFCTSYEIVEVRPYDSRSCHYASPTYLMYVNTFQIIVWVWVVWTLEMIRLFIIASITGSNYFHPNVKLSFSKVLNRALGSSFGTLSFAGLITSLLDIVRKRNRRWCFWCGPQILFFAFIELLICLFGVCMLNMAYVFTKFSVVLHAITGKSFEDSGRQCHEIMRRRFVGGYITEISSQSVLWFSSIMFSLLTSTISWWWMDLAFQCNSFAENTWNLILILLGLIFFHPVLGVVVVIWINIWNQNAELYRFEMGEATYQHTWVPVSFH